MNQTSAVKQHLKIITNDILKNKHGKEKTNNLIFTEAQVPFEKTFRKKTQL